MLAADRVGVYVAVLQVEARPQQFGPDIVGDDAWVGADQSADGARGGQRAGGIEPSGDPAPLLAVAEEVARPGEQAALRARHQRLADAVSQGVVGLGVGADGPAVGGGNPRPRTARASTGPAPGPRGARRPASAPSVASGCAGPFCPRREESRCCAIAAPSSPRPGPSPPPAPGPSAPAVAAGRHIRAPPAPGAGCGCSGAASTGPTCLPAGPAACP